MWKFELKTTDNALWREVPEPVGWDGVKFDLKRDKNSHGIFFSYTGKLKFYDTGKEIVKHAFDNLGGISAQVGIRIFRANEFGIMTANSLFYEGILSMDSYEEDSIYAIVPVEQSGFLQKFLAGQERKIDLANPTEVLLHSRKVPYIINYEYEEVQRVVSYASANVGTTPDFYGATLSIQSEILQGDESEIRQYFEIFYTGINDDAAVGFSVKRTVTCEVTVRFMMQQRNNVPEQIGDYFLQDFPTSTYWMGLRVINTNDYVYRFIREDVNGSYDTSDNITHTFTVTLQPNVYDIEYYWAESSGNTVMGYEYADANNFTYYFIDHSATYRASVSLRLFTERPATFCKSHFVSDAFSKIISDITEKPDAFQSSYFDQERRVITNGINIRRALDRNGQAYKTFASFKELFEGLSAIDCLGLGIERNANGDYLRVEPISYFYKNQVADVSFFDIQDIKRQVFREEYYNIAQLGYAKWQVEDVAGLDEFNSQWDFFFPQQKQIRRTYIRRSGLIAAGYVIEKVRRLQFKDTTDSQWDNDLFVICVTQNGAIWQAEKNEFWQPPHNVFSPETVYNWRLHPYRSLIRHLPILQSSHPTIHFLKAAGNQYASYASLDDNLENQLTHNNALFKMIKVDFESPLSWQDFTTLLYGDSGRNLYKKIAFSAQGAVQSEYGFLQNISYSPNELKAKVTLILSV